MTLDIGLQREAEEIARKELAGLRADAISILVFVDFMKNLFQFEWLKFAF